MPSAPSATVAEFTLPSPSAPSAALAAVGAATPEPPVPAVLELPTALLFEPVFTPALPAGGGLLLVVGRTANGRAVYTSNGRSGSVEGGLLTQFRPEDGTWSSVWFNGTFWRFDLWHDGELKLYFLPGESFFTNPWNVTEWYFADNPGVYPDESWLPSELCKFTFTQTSSGCVLVPSYAPPLISDPLLLRGESDGGAFYASGADVLWNGESWEGWDVALQLDGTPNNWIFGELGSGPTWKLENHQASGPPVGLPMSPYDGGASGLIRLRIAPPNAPSRAVAAYTAPTPSAPSPTV